MQETIIGYEAPPGGPSYIGQLAEVAVGTYTEITEIIAPAEASPGDLVSIEIQVRNLYTSPIYIATTGRYDSVDILPTEDYAIVDPGATHSFYFSFTMPNNDIELRVWSFYWTGAEWYQDDYSYVDFALKEEIMLDGELLIAYAWWEGKDGWNEILETNTWPPDTETTTAWKVRNTGNEDAFFKVRFMGLESAGVLLSPGGEATLYLYPVTPGVGTYDYTLELIADGQVVAEYPVQVIASEAVPVVSWWPLAIIGGLGILGVVGAVVALSVAKPME